MPIQTTSDSESSKVSGKISIFIYEEGCKYINCSKSRSLGQLPKSHKSVSFSKSFLIPMAAVHKSINMNVDSCGKRPIGPEAHVAEAVETMLTLSKDNPVRDPVFQSGEEEVKAGAEALLDLSKRRIDQKNQVIINPAHSRHHHK